jgi:hypothetical protein
MVPPTEPQSKWHIDKSLNVAVLIALIGMIVTGSAAVGSGVWFASSQSTRLGIVEEWIKGNEIAKNNDLAAAATARERIIKLETQISTIHDDVKDIKQLLRGTQDRR